MKVVLWILILLGLAYGLYYGYQNKLVVQWLAGEKAARSDRYAPDRDIHDAVNFVKKPHL